MEVAWCHVRSSSEMDECWSTLTISSTCEISFPELGCPTISPVIETAWAYGWMGSSTGSIAHWKRRLGYEEESLVGISTASMNGWVLRSRSGMPFTIETISISR